jgi:hypothetical protein
MYMYEKCSRKHCILFYLLDGVQRHFQQYFSYTVAVSFIGGGNRRKPTDLSQVTDKLYHIMLHTSPSFDITLCNWPINFSHMWYEENVKQGIILWILHRLQCKLNYLICQQKKNDYGHQIHLWSSDLYFCFLQIIYHSFILYHENIIQIFYWNRGKIRRMPADLWQVYFITWK